MQIVDGVRSGKSACTIVGELARAVSTVARELARNRGDDGSYEPFAAHAKMRARRPRPKMRRMEADAGPGRYAGAVLRTGRPYRRPRRRGGQRRPSITPTSQRPAHVLERVEPGHWEGDCIIGSYDGSAIATLVGRTTRYTILLHLDGDSRAGAVRDQLIATIDALPPVAAAIAHLGPGKRDMPPSRSCEVRRHAGLLLRPRTAMGAAEQREHERAAA